MSIELNNDEAELLDLVTQQTRFALVCNVLQHPEGLPSMYELQRCNPSVSEATVYKHVQKLVEAGVLEEVTLPAERRRQGHPWKFYGLTEGGWELLADHGLLAAEPTLERIYDTVTDRPAKMQKYQDAPRPASRAEG